MAWRVDSRPSQFNGIKEKDILLGNGRIPWVPVMAD